MEDERIVALYWERSEAALQQTQKNMMPIAWVLPGESFPIRTKPGNASGREWQLVAH